jgi:excisionase family DNA binding protein
MERTMAALVTEESHNVAPLVVSPKAACLLIDCSNTRLYELLNSGEISSYRDGKSRKIIVASLKDLIERRLREEVSKEQRGWTERATLARVKKRKLMRPTGHQL